MEACFMMVSEFLLGFCNRNHIVFAALIVLLALQPLGARADQCDDAWAAHQRGSPEIRDATVRGLTVDLDGDVEARQKAICTSDKGFVDLTRLLLDGVRRLEQACGSRHKLVCNVACWEKDLSEREKKSAYDCSPATLEAVRKADQAAKAERDKADRSEFVVQSACINVIAMAAFPDLPKDSDYKKNVKLCNANVKACEYARGATLKGENWPSDLTCGG
jgi:hypothetical protein